MSAEEPPGLLAEDQGIYAGGDCTAASSSAFLAGMVFGLILALWLVLHAKG
ncbi:MAG TPA: hypothetical protein VNT01_15080 [Symbiobacteriaceae bacterium]|nr:hypothetical protein [Symbiobacteriaceae bacterium]